MVSTQTPYTGIDIDFQIDDGGESHRGKSIEITKRIDREETNQLGTSDITYIKTSTRYEWNIEVDEISTDNLDAAFFEELADGSTLHHIDISKDGEQLMTISGVKVFDYREAHAAGGISSITISGTAADINPS